METSGILGNTCSIKSNVLNLHTHRVTQITQKLHSIEDAAIYSSFNISLPRSRVFHTCTGKRNKDSNPTEPLLRKNPFVSSIIHGRQNNSKIKKRNSTLLQASYASPSAVPVDALDEDGTNGKLPFSSVEDHSYDSHENNTLHGMPSGKLVTWSLIWSLLAKEKAKLACAIVGLLGGTCCALILPQFSGRFLETLIGKRPGPLSKLLSVLATIYFLEPLCTVLYVTSLISAWEKVMGNVYARVFERLLVKKVEFYDQHKVGELTSLLSSELDSVSKLVTDNVSRDRGFRSLCEVFGTLGILWTLSRDLAPTFGVLIIGISAGIGIYKRFTAPIFKLHAATRSRMIECANETFSAIRTVRSFGGERRQLAAFEGQVAVSRSSGARMGFYKSLNEAWTRVAVYLSLLLVYTLGGAKVKAGILPVGTMVSFIGYTFTLTFAVQGLVNSFSDLRNVLSAVERVNELSDVASLDASLAKELGRERSGREGGPAKEEGEEAEAENVVAGGGKRVGDLAKTGDLALQNVRFWYPQRPEATVLKGINLRLPRGSVTALVGSSGAGKSTVVQLLSRFYEPTDGVITLGGEDIRGFSKLDWSRTVSLVNQDPVLFAMSVRDNIAYGLPNEEVTDQLVEEAARAANAHEFIQKLPEGYNTLVGERGGLLSGGQRQRVAIARALLKNSPILILDEATSALDSVSERLVQEALERLMKGRTTLVIAHRLSTVQSASQIAVLSAGEVIELGSHNELVAKGGSYASLVNSQRLSFE